MKSLSFRTSVEDLPAAAERLKALAPQLVLIFGAYDKLQNTSAFAQFSKKVEGAQIIGCSTSGEIDSNGVSDKGLVVAAVHFDRSSIKIASYEMTRNGYARVAGLEIAQTLQREDLKGVFILVPGVKVNGSLLVGGIREILSPRVVISGGLAGDGLRFKETLTILNGETYASRIIAIGLYGKDLIIGAGSRGGWKPFGPARRVTKSQGNILYELDGKPALELYKTYLGEKAAELPASGMPYPLAVLRDDRSATGLIRSVVDVDPVDSTLILGGDVEENSLVCLMHGNSDFLSEGSAEAAKEALGSDEPNNKDSLNILVSCVGRRAVMGEDTDDEIDAAIDVLGKNATICGFYSYGEICPFTLTGKAELHNHTMTITHIHERTPD